MISNCTTFVWAFLSSHLLVDKAEGCHHVDGVAAGRGSGLQPEFRIQVLKVNPGFIYKLGSGSFFKSGMGPILV